MAKKQILDTKNENSYFSLGLKNDSKENYYDCINDRISLMLKRRKLNIIRKLNKLTLENNY